MWFIDQLKEAGHTNRRHQGLGRRRREARCRCSCLFVFAHIVSRSAGWPGQPARVAGSSWPRQCAVTHHCGAVGLMESSNRKTEACWETGRGRTTDEKWKKPLITVLKQKHENGEFVERWVESVHTGTLGPNMDPETPSRGPWENLQKWNNFKTIVNRRGTVTKR